MQTLIQDLVYGWRLLVRQPWFTLVAVVTLAVGTGANTAVFSVVNSVLWSPLPYAEPERLVMVWSRNLVNGQPRFGVSAPDFNDWHQQNQVCSDLAAFNSRNGNLTGRGVAERIRYATVTGEFFQVFGIQPLLGRAFTNEEDQPGNDNVVVLSHRFWQRSFAGDRTVIGQALTLDSRNHTIVGVMPEGFGFPSDDIDLWRPITLQSDPSPRGARYLAVVARLKPGVGAEQVNADLDGVAGRLATDYPETNRNWQIFPESLHEATIGSIRPTLFVLWGVTGCVLLIACVNVSGLLLARTRQRGKEVALRAALGASRARLIRQLLTESLLLALASGLVGILLAFFCTDLLSGVGATILPRAPEVKVDSRVLLFTVAVSALTNILFGLLPAWQAARPDLNEALKEGARAVIARGPMRNLMVIGEIAVALVVLAGAGLLVRSFIRLMAVDTGFNPDSVLTLRVAPAWIAVPEGTDEDEFFRQLSLERERADVFYQQLVEQIAALPGVESCAAINRLPLTGNWWQTTFAIEDQPVATRQDMFKCNSRVITPGYFETMQVALLEGRDLDARDRADAPRSVIVNQEVARRYFAGASPLGKRISFESPDEGRVAWFAIVGVAADERDQSLEVEPHPMIYVPFAQARFGHFGDWGMSLVVRTHSDPMASVGSVREAVQGLDRNLPVAEVRTMSQLVARSAAGQRFNMLLLVFFAATALLLASVGVYVVIAQTVSQRTREIGIRVALGAQRRDVMRMVMKQGLATTLLGVAIGLAAAFALTRVMSTLLFEVSATDPLTFGSIGALLIGVSLFACMIPARRATKVDPMVALRYE